jgi:hypothetical protein
MSAIRRKLSTSSDAVSTTLQRAGESFLKRGNAPLARGSAR